MSQRILCFTLWDTKTTVWDIYFTVWDIYFTVWDTNPAL